MPPPQPARSRSPPPAVRLQLAHLEEDGLLTHHDDVTDGAGRGRPRHVYELTSAAESLYPKRYGDLTTELLGYLGGPARPGRRALRATPAPARRSRTLPAPRDLPFDEQVAGAGPRSSTRTATWRTRSGCPTVAGASPSTTAPSSPSPTGSRRPARASWPSSVTRSRGPRWAGWRTSWTGPTCAPTSSARRRRRVRRPDLQDRGAVHLVDLALEELDEVVAADLDDELVDRLPRRDAFQDVDGHDVPPTAPIRLATRPRAPGRSGSAILTT